MSVRVRFAPSPTGHLHVGNARTALFNFLYARHTGGTFLLRIEDTDLERSSVESENLIYEDMKWLGMDWDEGPVKGGDVGPYRQMERVDIYKKQIEKLEEGGHVYKCFCTKEELDDMRERARIESRPPRYDGRCRRLSAEQVEENVAAGTPCSLRFKVQTDTVRVTDAIRGEIPFDTDSFGDFIIMRPDGTPIYNFVVAIDDALMKITHVIRGDDHLSNTPKQVLIYDALGLEKPIFAHIPMILGPDHAKLSKRHGNTSVEMFREEGYLPEAMFNYMSLLSWSHPDEEDIHTQDEIIQAFTLERVSKSAAVFDFDKLRWLNGMYIRSMDIEEITRRCVPYLLKAGIIDQVFVDTEFEKLTGMVNAVRDNLEVLSDIVTHLPVFFTISDELDEAAADVMTWETTPAVLKALESALPESGSLDVDTYKALVKEVGKTAGAKGKMLFMAVRIGVTGRSKGPELDSFIPLMDTAELKRRINAVIDMAAKA